MPTFRQLQDFLQKRRTAQFRDYVAPTNALQRFLTELFLQTRFRRYVLAYLSVQEGEDFEGRLEYDSEAPRIIDGLLRSLGKESLLEFRPGFGRYRIGISLDPLLNLRAVYAFGLMSREAKSSWINRVRRACHNGMFKGKCGILGLFLRLSSIRFTRQRNLSESILRILRSRNGRRMVVLSIMLLFPKSRSWSDVEWGRVLTFIEEYFSAKVPQLLAVMSNDSVQSNGLIKLGKVFFGTLVGSSTCQNKWDCDSATFVIDSIRLAYSWGVTYPLVDNILDSSQTSSQVRDAICTVVRRSFSGSHQIDNLGYSDRGIKELSERLSEVSALIPDANRERARSLLLRLLEVHQRDSERRISEGQQFDEDEILSETTQKAALVRLATMEICGIEVDSETIARCEERGLFNQLGDDLWDIYEDAAEKRVTPFTNFLVSDCPRSFNPFVFYVNYSKKITSGMSRYRCYSTMLGCAESFRDLHLSFGKLGNDSLFVWSHISETLRDEGIEDVEDFLSQVPHVDFDAVLFEAERAIFENVI